MELLQSTGDPARDRNRIRAFFERLKPYGLSERCVVLLVEDAESEAPSLAGVSAHGLSMRRFTEVARSADLLWNFCGTIKQPLLSLFKRRILVDLDPGIFQISALHWDLGIADHHRFLTVGSKLRDADCEVPRLGAEWHTFRPFAYLPMWSIAPDPGPEAPFSSITQWNWHEVWLGRRVLSASKRQAYIRYLDLPNRTGRRFELAANIDPNDETGDREALRDHGWKLVDPHSVVPAPGEYQRYIRASRAEIACPKPIYRELKTGWLSDRSVCYLAVGRPVLCEDTGFSDHLPTGEGLLAFQDLDGAAEAVARVDRDYKRHTRAARDYAEEFFDSRRCLTAMVDAC
jgi:hypothetical protein